MNGAIWYKDVWAAKGSELHRLLSEGKTKEAERCHKETAQRAAELLTRYNHLEKRDA